MWRYVIIGALSGVAAVVASGWWPGRDRAQIGAADLGCACGSPSQLPAGEVARNFAYTFEVGGSRTHSHPATRPAASVALDVVVKEMATPRITLGELVDYLRHVTNTNIVVQWGAMERAGMLQDKTIELYLREVSARKVLDTALAQFSESGRVPLRYWAEENIVTITTAGEPDRGEISVCVYDIRRLVSRMTEHSQQAQAGAATRPAFMETVTFSGQIRERASGSRAEMEEEAIIDLMNFIKQSVEIDSWVDNGGRVGTLQYVMGRLIVRQTRVAHAQIVALLTELERE